MSTRNNHSYMTTSDDYIMNGSYDPNHHNGHEDWNEVNGRTPPSTYRLTSLPPEDFAEYNWPPSIYQAAQYAYSTPLPLRQRLAPDPNDHATSEEESWQVYHAGPFSYLERSRDLALPHMDDSIGVYYEDPSTMVYPDFRASPTMETVSARTSINSRSPDAPQVNTSSNMRLKLHCRVCVDKPSFTGQYAQRNLNRHMERFHSACAASDDGRHIRCQQPGCSSTFGRPDALLVHLRRSHPELNTPPPKKRKRADMDS